MSKLPLVLLFFISTAMHSKLSAGEPEINLLCKSLGKPGARVPQNVQIEISKDLIIATKLDTGERTEYKREDPGLFSYWGTNSGKFNKTNEQLIRHLRLNLSTQHIQSQFEMEIAFIWEHFYFDASGFTSIAQYKCELI